MYSKFFLHLQIYKCILGKNNTLYMKKKHHIFNERILRKYDIRGIVNETLFDEDAFAIGMSMVEYLKMQNLEPTIAIIKDARPSGISLKKNVADGIIFAGGNVVDCGIGSTPMIYFASIHLKTSGFVAITGSHNPLQYNGFKFGITGKAFSDEEIQKLAKIANDGVFFNEKGSVIKYEIAYKYISRILENVSIPKNLKFGFNALNGAAGLILPEIVKNIGGIAFECDMDAKLQTVLDPSNKQNIERMQNDLKKHNLDIIFAFDGDADRIMAVTNEKILFGDDILFLCVKEVLAKEKGKIIFDVKCSNLLADEITKLGGVPIMYKTGHSLIKKKMIEESAILAGECSGHIYFKNEYYGFDDGIYTAMRLLSYFSKNDLQKEIISFPKTFKSDEIKIPCEKKFQTIEKLQAAMKKDNIEFNDIDGMRVNFSSTSWFLIRASNTEEVLIVKYEALDENEFKQVKNFVDAYLSKVV